MKLRKRLMGLFLEFCRYLLVGGSAFLIDFGIMYGVNEYVFHGHGVYVSTALGYIIGLIYNYILSCIFVFKDGAKKVRGKEIQSFIIFSIIGLIGLGLTELFMYVFIDFMNIYYVIARVVTSVIVVFWNYIARKIIIYR